MADDPPPSPGNAVRTPGISQATSRAASQVLATSNAKKAAWLADIEATQKKRNRGLLIGAGGAGGGILIGLISGQSASLGGVVFGGLVSASSAIYGGWTYVRAKDHLEDLDREGRAKGYTFLPQPAGPQPAFVLASVRF